MLSRNQDRKRTTRKKTDQEQHFEDLLKKQGMINCNPLKSPLTVNETFVTANDNNEMADATSYRSLIGSLLFLAKLAHLDFLHDVNLLFGFMNKPTKGQMQGAKKYCDIFMVIKTQNCVPKAKRSSSVKRK